MAYKRKSYRGRNTWGNTWAKRAKTVARVARYAYKAYNGSGKTKTSQRSSAPAPLTSHFDARTVYRKRRMPYAKKRRWIRQKRSVNAVLNSRLGTNVSLLRNNGTSSNAIGAQAFLAFTQFDSDQRTLLADAVHRLQPELPLLGVQPGQGTQKFVVVGTMMNVLLRNTTATGVAYLDIYYWTAKRDVPTAEFASINSMWSSGFNYNVINSKAGESPLVFTDPGVTPWANPVMRKFVNITMKRRVRLPAGADTEISLRSPRNWYNSGEQFNDMKSMLRGVTGGILIVFRGGPTGTSQSEAQTIAFTQERTAYYKVLQGNVMTAGDAGNGQ